MDRARLLVVEDDSELRDGLQDLFEEKGYEVIPARTGMQAVEFLSADPHCPPDVVILDLMMPIMTGWQVIDTIRHNPLLMNVPIVVLTAISQDMPTGVAAVIRKPFDIDVLVATVERQVHEHTPAPSA